MNLDIIRKKVEEIIIGSVIKIIMIIIDESNIGIKEEIITKDLDQDPINEKSILNQGNKQIVKLLV